MESITILLLLIGFSNLVALALFVYKRYGASAKPESIVISENDVRSTRKQKKNRRKRKSDQSTKDSVNSKLNFTSEISRLSEASQEADLITIPAAVQTSSCKLQINTNLTIIAEELLDEVDVKKTDVTSTKSLILALADQPENDGRTTTLYYIPQSEIRQIKGKGGRILKALERKYGVKIDLPLNDDGNVVISGGNETIRRTVEADIRDRMTMAISLPHVHPLVYAKIKAQVDLGKIKTGHQTSESGKRSISFTGLAKDCKEILNFAF